MIWAHWRRPSPRMYGFWHGAGWMSDKAVAAMTFEEAMAALEKVVRDLERGDGRTGKVDRAVRKRGAALKAHCAAQLRAAEEKVEKITLNAAGGSRRQAPHRWRGCRPLTTVWPQDASCQVGVALEDALGWRPDVPVVQAMRYAVQGGKRMRGLSRAGRRADAWAL